jgi:Domain of unknown function DUF29
MSSLYEKDFHAWCFDQVSFMERKELENLDWENLIQEIISMGGSVRQELENRLTVLFTHLLKWKFQEHLRSKSWERTIKEQRKRIKINFDTHPSLSSYIDRAVKNAYEFSIMEASKETGLPEEMFPIEMPWKTEQALTEDWLP